jgi:diguanylate cyclase (GGDEF)-like protein
MPLTVCFADIDGLKHINDTWGHGAGDAMIQSVAAVLKKYVTQPGKVCRLGGDEFLLILPEQTAAQASLLASQISREAARNVVGGSDGITMSFGFKQAEFVAGDTAETLAARVLETEHKILQEAVTKVAASIYSDKGEK